MNEEKWMKKLEEEGFTDLRVCPVNSTDMPAEPHTHDLHTVHVILEGELTVIDDTGDITVYKPGDYVEFPAGTTHVTSTNPEGVKMIVGVKE